MVSSMPCHNPTAHFKLTMHEKAGPDEPPAYYNSACLVDRQGKVVTTYQKTFLYEVDEAWAQEGPGFKSMYIEGLGQVSNNWHHYFFFKILSCLIEHS